jgi:hypothetical protein
MSLRFPNAFRCLHGERRAGLLTARDDNASRRGVGQTDACRIPAGCIHSRRGWALRAKTCRPTSRIRTTSGITPACANPRLVRRVAWGNTLDAADGLQRTSWRTHRMGVAPSRTDVRPRMRMAASRRDPPSRAPTARVAASVCPRAIVLTPITSTASIWLAEDIPFRSR